MEHRIDPNLVQMAHDFSEEWKCTPTQEQQVVEIVAAGERHGIQGWYPDGEFGSDADWCLGTGAVINQLELELRIDDGSLFNLYREAHELGQAELMILGKLAEGLEGDEEADGDS